MPFSGPQIFVLSCSGIRGDATGMAYFNDGIIEINRRSVFSLEEAQQLLPVVFKITKAYRLKVQSLIERLDTLDGQNESLVASLEEQVNQAIQDWQTKMQKLGAQPKGLWIADFDSGDGYFCWKYPERGIQFWHKYTDGFSKRVRVGERVVAREAGQASECTADCASNSVADSASGPSFGLFA